MEGPSGVEGPEPKRTPLPFPWPTGSYREELEDGFAIVEPIPSPDDVKHYEATLRENSEAENVREFYARGLYHHGRREEAVVQARILAERAEPGSHHHFTLAEWLRETGDLEGSLAVFEELRPYREKEGTHEQVQALFHWGISTTLADLGRKDEAIQELRTAVALMETGVREDRASPQLLRRLRQELARLAGPAN